ncbi:MAG TPA: response regulator [Nitrospirota bacterium]|nr:response regulator [Nitrospirota bacterium]
MSDPGFLPHSSAVLIGPCREAKKKVLIVDDEYLIRYSLEKLIEREGYTAFTAGTGHEALRLFEEHRPDIVILDIRLPDSNGLSLLKIIKESCPTVSMIMATGCPDVQSNVEALKMGALAYLEKPVDLDSLKTLMRCTIPAAEQIQ